MSDNIEAEKTVTIPNGKTVVSLNLPTPKWATWTFRIVYWLVFAFTIWIAATKLVPEASKVEVILAASVLDKLVWGIGRGLGVKKEDFADVS